MVRGLEVEDVTVYVCGKAGVEGRDLRQVDHYIVDPAERMWCSISVTDAGVPVVLRDNEGGVVVGKPLPHGIVMVLGLGVREVDPGVTGHARIHVGHENGDMHVGVTCSKRAAEKVTLDFTRGCGLEVHREQVEGGRG
jgi:hypothetical protein